VSDRPAKISVFCADPNSAVVGHLDGAAPGGSSETGKSGHQISGATEFTQIAQAYLHIPHRAFGIDHDDFGSVRSEVIMI
jgi:hypothetical protein